MPSKPSVVFVGQLPADGPISSRSAQRLAALRALDFEPEPVAWSIPLGDPSEGPLHEVVRRGRFHMGIPEDRLDANRELLRLARERPFQVLWLDRPLTIWPWTIWRLRQYLPDVLIGVWLEEHLAPRNNRSLYFGGVVRQCDVGFTPRSANLGCDWLKRHAPRELVLVDETYDPEFHSPTVDLDAPFTPAADVAFVGTFERDRAEQLHYLARHGIKVTIWGNGWEHFAANHPNMIVTRTAVLGRDYAHVLCTARITLCFLRKANQDRQTNRTMEIPACGGFMLAERTPDHMRLFREGREAAYFSSREELLSQVRYYLEHEDERAAIARAGHERVKQGGHSHEDRMSYMLDVLLAPKKGQLQRRVFPLGLRDTINELRARWRWRQLRQRAPEPGAHQRYQDLKSHGESDAER